jgi:parvulin-like peptidyl-prolyl isomerase
MTYRSRPTPKPTRRRARQSDSRRTIYLEIAFGFCIFASIAMLGGVLFGNWYSDHWAPIASVNGQGISKDAVRDRAAVNLARFERQIANYGELRNTGKITSEEFETLRQTLVANEASSTLFPDALNQLTQESALQQYADKNGLKVTDEQLAAQIVEDGTLAELRHVKVIATDPVPTPPASVPTTQQIADARTKAQAYHDSIANGTKKWDDVATEANVTRVGAQGTNGDLFLTTKDALNLDPELANAVFALAKTGDLTDVVKCSDGLFRFATVTEIVLPYVDNSWESSIKESASGDAFRSAMRAAALKKVIQASIEDKYVTGDSAQRKVLEIALSPGYGQPGDHDDVKFRMMTFAPNNDPTNASSLDLADPAWTAAKARADAAVVELKKDPTKFDSMARDSKINDDTYWSPNGGELPWIPARLISGAADTGEGLGLTGLTLYLFAPNVTANEIIGPVQEPTQGWVVAQFLGRRPAPDQRIGNALLAVNTGSSFTSQVRAYSESADAVDGGDMGWVTRYMLDKDLEDAIFQTPVGGVSRIVSNGSGYWLFQVLTEQTRTPDPAHAEKLKKVVFNNWLTRLTESSNVWKDDAGLTAITPTE